MSDTAGKPIVCKAAVAWEVNKPLTIETIEVDPPSKHEVRIKVIATGVCHTDANALLGKYSFPICPTVLGHEGAGIVESVGEGVTTVKPGDHVIPLWLCHCKNCKYCESETSNHCKTVPCVLGNTVLPSDGKPRFKIQGKPINHFMTCSTFSQYIVVPDINVAKINPAAPLDKVCLIGCGVPTGYGAAVNTAGVKPGTTCAVWGLGGVGLAAVMGCKANGAKRIIGIDTNPAKFDLARKMGCTEFINPKDQSKPISEVIHEMTDGGVDYAIECIGLPSTIRTAFDSVHDGWGVAVIVGVAASGQEISLNPTDFLCGRSVKGTFFGGFKGRDDLPKLVDRYLEGKLLVDDLITHTFPLEKINEAFEIMHAGKSLRSVVNMW